MSNPAPPALRPLRLAVGVAVVAGAATAVAGVAGGADPATAGLRLALAALPALLVVALLRRLGRGSTRAFARIRRSAVIAAVVLLAVAATGTGPPWLRALQAAQAVAQLAVLAATLRPALRRWYAEHRDDPERAGAWRPALLLAVLAPLVAEVSIGNLAFTPAGALAAATALPIYGGGALLARELVRRTGRGWPSILLLGLAYGVVEEGMALRAFFDPLIYGGLPAAWGARVFGVNGTYTLVQLVNHAVWSVAVPVLLTELALPRYRARPWLGGVGLTGAALVFVLGAGLTALGARTQLSPGFPEPVGAMIACAAAVVVLAVVALRVLPAAAGRVHFERPAPSPRRVLAMAFGAGFGFLAVLVLPGRLAPQLMQGPAVLGPLAAALALVVVAAVLVRRWSAAAGWCRAQALALAGGALLGHTLLWGVTQPVTWTDRIGVGVLSVITVIGLLALARQGSSGPPDRVENGRDRPAGWQADRVG
jgi:hypothetical protein